MIAIKLETDCKILHQQAKTLQTEIVVKLVAVVSRGRWGVRKENKLPRNRAHLEPQRKTASNVELMQVVAIPDCPASTPERIAPIPSIGSGDISWRPLELSSQTKVPANVVFRAPA